MTTGADLLIGFVFGVVVASILWILVTARPRKAIVEDVIMSDKLIIIEVKGGIIIDVHGLPEGWKYRVLDRDDEARGD